MSLDLGKIGQCRQGNLRASLTCRVPISATFSRTDLPVLGVSNSVLPPRTLNRYDRPADRDAEILVDD